jgi:hypothetical protein
MLATTILLMGILLGSWPGNRDAVPLYATLAGMILLFYIMHERVAMVILALFMLATLTPQMVRNLRGLV